MPDDASRCSPKYISYNFLTTSEHCFANLLNVSKNQHVGTRKIDNSKKLGDLQMITMSRRILYMVLGGVIALAVVGAMIGGTAVFAQDEEPTLPPAEELVVPPIEDGEPGLGPRGEGFHGRGPRQGRLQDDSFLADALGITEDELDAAKEAVRAAQLEEVVAQALADGLITEEQAEAILSGDGSGRSLRGLGLHKHGERGEGDELLAAELGISVDELEAAKETAREAALDQAIADGLITQEQADLMAAGQALRDYLDQDAVLAGLLGLSAEELEAAKEEGSIRDLVEASGLTQEEIMTAMQEARETAVAEAVADGVITQEQADQLEAMPGRGGFGGPRGGHGRGGFGGPCGGEIPNDAPGADAPAAPDTTNTSDA
jgi:hypothetical protein